MRLRFPKSSRLLQRSQFLRVQRGGQRIDVGPVLAFVLPSQTPGQGIQLGLTTSKKVGNAVFRNRLRRLMREAARRFLLIHPSLDFDVVLIAKKGLSLELGQEKMDRALLKLVRILQKKTREEKPVSENYSRREDA